MLKKLVLAVNLPLILLAPRHYGVYWNETESAQPLEFVSKITKSIIEVESSWRPEVVSHKGAIGLMQITQPALDEFNSRWGVDYELSSMTNIKKNVQVGMWYFWERLVPLYNGDIEMALHSYNMGMGNLKKGRSNAIYVQRVLEGLESFNDNGSL